MSTRGDSPTDSDDALSLDAEPGSVPGKELRASEPSPLADSSLPWRHSLQHTHARARSSSRSSSRSAASELRRIHDDEARRELVNLPAIPLRFLQTGRPASVALPPAPKLEPPTLRRAASTASPRDNVRRGRPPLTISATPSRRRDAITLEPSVDANQQGTQHSRVLQPAIPRTQRARATTVHTNAWSSSKTTTPILLPTPTRERTMDFYDSHRSPSHISAKRRSLPADIDIYDRRPSTSSGHIHMRPMSRLNTNRSTDLRHMDLLKSPTTRSLYQQATDSASLSGHSSSGRAARRYSNVPDRSPLSPTRLRERLQSPEVPQYGRRRPSFGAPLSMSHPNTQFANVESSEESPAEESEPKLSESTSAESQQDDSVWDELDVLKLRIKELEMKDKVPTVSSAAASRDSSDRPRTATTAPTTIDSSPKHERKREVVRKKQTPTPPPESSMGGNPLSNIHPPLHTALAKAQTLLNASLYRTLEATSNDALQLAAITGSAGPQGTNFSAASIINGLTVSDRHVRRKVDNMCRNLTELTIALCEGKHEAAEIVSSPTSMGTARQESPSFRFSASHAPSRVSSQSRPMSRLDARRSSILGENSLVAYESISPRGSVGDASEQEPTPAKSAPAPSRRVSRVSSGLRSRMQHQDETSGEEEGSLRPPSRAMTDVGASRSRSRITNENKSPITQRTPSLREVLASKRHNEVTYESNRATPRISSLGSDRKRLRLYDEPSTPPVVEEEYGHDDYHTPSQPRRRVTSMGGQFNARRSIGDLPGRASSLHQRRHIITE